MNPIKEKMTKEVLENKIITLAKIAVNEAHKKGSLENLTVVIISSPEGLQMDYTTSDDRKDYILSKAAV
jgi:hypothetical protein